MKVGFIGLGNMGMGMARRLLTANFDLSVFNRTRSKADQLKAEGATIFETARDLASNVDILVTMVADDFALCSLLHDQAVLDGLRGGTIHLSMSTVSPDLIRELTAEHLQRNVMLVSAPVFGRPDVAAQGQLWIVAAGSEQPLKRCEPLLEAMGRGVTRVGTEPFQANVVKVAGNFMIASMLEALGESFALIRKWGLDVSQYLGILDEALFHSPLYRKYGAIIAEARYSPAGFKLKHGLKDVRLALQAADRVETPMPLASLLHDHYLAAAAQGWEDLDWTALAKLSATLAGLKE